MIFRSLRANLNLGLLLTGGLLAVALWSLLGVALERIISEYIETRLEHDAETLLVATTIDQSGNILLDKQTIQNIYRQPFSGHYYVISNPQQTLYSRSLWDEALGIEQKVEADGIEITRQSGPRQQQLLVRRQVYQKQGSDILIVTAEDISHVAEQIEDLQRQFGVLILIVVVLLLIAQSLIVYFSMRSVKQAKKAIKKLESGEASQLPENVPNEVQPLVREINRLLQHQQQRLDRSRNAMGDVAHAIKTPLSLILQWYDSLEQSEQQQHESVLRQVNLIQQRVDSELKRARMAGDRRSSQRFNLEQDLPDLLETFRRLYHDKSLDLKATHSVDPVLPLEQGDGVELLGNLLDNACKWASHDVAVGFDKQADSLRIYIEDDGPGIDPGLGDALLQRGRRQDETVSGHGIGLSIVKQIVDSYQGSLKLARSEQLGGLRVEVNLPLLGDSD